jgi:hypothetical protein
MKTRICASICSWLVALSAIAQPSASAQDPVFVMTSAALYQPNDVLVERLGDASGLASYAKALVAAASDEISKWPSRTPVQGILVVAVKPNGGVRVWLVVPKGSMPDAQSIALKRDLEAVAPVVAVRIGPVAFAINFSAWGAAPATPEPPPIPDEWRAAMEGRPAGVIPDAVLAVIWP